VPGSQNDLDVDNHGSKDGNDACRLGLSLAVLPPCIVYRGRDSASKSRTNQELLVQSCLSQVLLHSRTQQGVDVQSEC